MICPGSHSYYLGAGAKSPGKLSRKPGHTEAVRRHHFRPESYVGLETLHLLLRAWPAIGMLLAADGAHGGNSA